MSRKKQGNVNQPKSRKRRIVREGEAEGRKITDRVEPLPEQLEKEMTQHEEGSLWERIFSRGNLMEALNQVERNKGAAGVDGMSVEELPKHLKNHWVKIRAKLEAGEYEPSPVRRQSRIDSSNRQSTKS